MDTEDPDRALRILVSCYHKPLQRHPSTVHYAVLIASMSLWVCRNPTWFFDPGYTLCSRSHNIYTVNDSSPRVECMFVRHSFIIDIGTFDEIGARRLNVKPQLVPLQLFKMIHRRNTHYIHPESVIVPGLADAHAHIPEYGLMKKLPLADATSVEDVVQILKSYLQNNPDILNDRSKWIEGLGWDHTKFPGSHLPTFEDFNMEPLLHDRLISLTNKDCHAKWVSQRVLESMGDLPEEVEGGYIVRYEKGKPTGIFMDRATELIPSPQWTEEQLSHFFDVAMKDALSYGLTSIHEAASLPDYISLFQRKAEIGEMPLRLYVMGHIQSNDYWGTQLPHLRNYGKHQKLTLRSAKLFADGELGSWGAALLEPYADKPSTRGFLATPPETLLNFAVKFWKDGFQVNIHASGDRAIRSALDAIERVLQEDGAEVSRWRPRIEHARVISPEDLERMGKLGVIASVQPTHATSDMTFLENRLGNDRAQNAYIYQSLLNVSKHQILPIGSDSPVESINPLLGFYAAVSRLDHNRSSPHGPGGWFPEERLTRAQALKGMTLDAAYASFEEERLGSLTPGKKADFVVLDRDIMSIPFAEILETKVIATVIDGKVEYGRLW